MEIVKIDLDKPNHIVIEKAAQTMHLGGVLIYPSDTSYGIGVDPTNDRAVQKVIKLKSRSAFKPMSVIMPDFETIEETVWLDVRTKKILNHYLPGQFTFVLINLNPKIMSLTSLGIRMPKLDFVSELSKQFGAPYTTTSANLSGEEPAYSIDELEHSLLDIETLHIVPDLVLDAGQLPKRLPSTVVDLTHWPPKILRQGEPQFDWHQFD